MARLTLGWATSQDMKVKGHTSNLGHLLSEAEIMALTPKQRRKYIRVGRKWRKR